MPSTLLALCLWLPGADAPQTPVVPPRPLDRVRPGMTPEEVRQALGRPPDRVSRQLFFGRYLEQWTYLPPVSARVEFLAERTGSPAVRAVRPINPSSP
jgi:hypothetical protein